MREIAHANQRCLIADDNTSTFKANKRQEHANTGRNGASQGMRNAIHQPASHAGYGQEQEDNTGNKDRAQRLLP